VVNAQDFINWFSPQATPQPGQQPQGGRMTPQQAMVQRRMAMQFAQQNPTAGAKVGPYQIQNGWTAAADALRMGMAGLLARNANTAELGNIAAGSAATPSLGNPGPQQPGGDVPPDVKFSSPTPQQSGSAGGDTQLAGDPLSYIKAKEGFSAAPYADGRQTSIGYGTKAQPGDTKITQQEAEQRLQAEAAPVADFINRNVKVPLNDAQRTALTSFGYNLGVGQGGLSDIIPAVNRGDFQGAAAQMQHYMHFQGQPDKGLIARRQEEGLMLTGGGDQQPGQQPQAQGAGSMLPPLPSDQQIHALLANPDPEFRDMGRQFLEQKRQALQPQMMTTPTGQQLLFNPYTGTRDTGIPGKPLIEQMPIEVPGYKGVRPMTYGVSPSGQQYLQAMPIVPPGGTPPGAGPQNIGQVPPMQRPLSPGSAPGAPGPGGGQFQPMGAQAAPAPGQGGPGQQLPGAGYMPTAGGGLNPFNVGPGGTPVQNSQVYGEMAGPGAAGRMPNPDTASPEEFAAWAQRRQAETAGMMEQSKAVGGALGKLHAAAIADVENAPRKLQDISVLRDAYQQMHTPGGPAAETLMHLRSLYSQMVGSKEASAVPASELIQKFNTILSFEATRELTSRPALLELIMQSKANPGMQMNDVTAQYLLGLMQQKAMQDVDIGHMAAHTMDSREFFDKREKYFNEHPLMSPFTGKALKTRGDVQEDIANVMKGNPETAQGILGSANPFGGSPAPAPGPANLPAGHTEDGYRFKGGDPGNQANWEKVE
jgi:lysozyme